MNTMKRGYCAAATWVANCNKVNGQPLNESEVIVNNRLVITLRATVKEQNNIKRNVGGN